MALRNFICPDGIEIPIGDCLEGDGCRRENRCATRSYLRLVSRERKWTGKPSTTQLINGTMLAWLRLTTNYAVSPDDRAFMIHGTKSHSNLQLDDDYSIVEERLDGDDTEVTGIFDVYESEAGLSTLVDYKTSGSYKVAKALGFFVEAEPTGEVFKSGHRKGLPKTVKILKRDDEHVDRWEWELQLNKYRIELERRGFPVDDMRIMCVVRDGNTYIARSRGVYRNTYYFKIARLSDDVVEDYFRKKRHALMVALKYGWKKPCTGAENWDGLRCARYCEVAVSCPYGKYLKEEKETEDMPIKNLSEVRRLPRIGKIALGQMVANKSGNGEHPEEINWFRLRPSTESEEENRYLQETFRTLYGEKPTSIKIMFPVADREQIFPQYFKSYGKSTGLKCKGDGETATCWNDDYLKKLKRLSGDDEGRPLVECKGDDCPYATDKACARMATLQVLLYEMPGSGVWQVTTGSINSIININSDLDWIESMAGRIQMIPLSLQRVPQQITHEGHARTHYPLKIDMGIPLKELLGYGELDPRKVLLGLPPIPDSREDVMFQTTPEGTVHDAQPALPEPEKVRDAGDFNGLVSVLADKWGEESGVVIEFLIEKFSTHAKAMLNVRPNLQDVSWMKDFKSVFDSWMADVEPEPVEFVSSVDEDSTEQTPTASDGDVAMESAEAIQEQIDAKLKRIQGLLPTAITDVESKEFRTWAWGILDAGADEEDKVKGTPIAKLPMMNLDILIGEMETREDNHADKAAETNGQLPL
jgi:hypothetical protein